MTMRQRKLVGTILLLAFIAVYALLAMRLAVGLQVNASRLAAIVYYVVAGLAWTLPAGLIIAWMGRPDAS